MTSITVFIPTLNAGPEFGAVLDAVLGQKDCPDFEIRVTDSSSDDSHTVRALESRSIPCDVISREDFDHGETRNNAARSSQAEYIAYLSQDARPADEHWLAALYEGLEHAGAAAAFSAQFPRPDCHPYQRVNLAKHMAEARETDIREPLTAEEFLVLDPVQRVERIRFDNVSSLIRRKELLARPFPRTGFGEDLAWARETLLGGKRIAFCPASRVIHSHEVNLDEFHGRVRAVHATLRTLCDFVPMDSRGLQLRRIAGTTLRFWSACLNGNGARPVDRFCGLFLAPWYAFLQMQGMWKGAHEASFDSPIPLADHASR